MGNVNRQHKPWGGNWTEKKLETFESYVRAYLTIMNKYRDKFGWKILYFDGFAGSGSRSTDERLQEEENYVQLFGEDLVDVSDLTVYQGAAERVVQLEQNMRGFDYYYFIDKFEENCTKLELKLSAYPTQGYKIYRPGDANEQILQLANAMGKDNHLKSLVFLDPFGMQIDWESIQRLAGKGVDLWILLPTGVIINRLLKKDGTLMYPEKLENFFGMTREEISKRFYERRVSLDLFGDEQEKYEKITDSITKIAELFAERLGEIFQYVTDKPLVLRNDHNVAIYHFVFASENPTAVKIAQQIIDKRQK